MGFKPIAPAYDAAALSVLEQACSWASERSTSTHIPSLNKDIQEALVKAIVDMAATGLRDPRILRARALQAVMNPGASKH